MRVATHPGNFHADAVFAHVAGFYASAGSRERITAPARLAMAQG